MNAQGPAAAEFSDYVYSGPVQSVQLKAKDAKGDHVTFFEGTFFPGKTYTLLIDHPTVAAWVCGHILKEVTEASNG